MKQIEIVNDYIKKTLPNFEKEKDNLYSFKEGEETKYICIVEEKFDKELDRYLLFDKDFKLILSKEEEKLNADYYAFNFGGNFFYTENSNSKSTKLNILRYLGKYEISNEDFVHLGLHSTFSLLNGCQKIEYYVKKANYLNMKALGICEKNSLRSVIKFQDACKKGNIKSILGEDIKVKIEDKFYWIKLFVKNKSGWKNLLSISNIINVFNKREGKNYIEEEDLREYLYNLIVILPNDFPFKSLSEEYKNFDCYYQIDTVEFIDKDFYFEYLNNIKKYIENYSNIFKPVLIGDSYYLDKEDFYLRDILIEISDKKEFEYATKDRYFKSIEEHIEKFSKFWKNKEDKFDDFMAKCIENTIEISNKCDYKIDFEKLHIPMARIDIKDWEEAQK